MYDRLMYSSTDSLNDFYLKLTAMILIFLIQVMKNNNKKKQCVIFKALHKKLCKVLNIKKKGAICQLKEIF